MANWYVTSFETNDKDIVELIKNGRTVDFDYDETDEQGWCRLAWGIGSLDVEEIERVAKANKSSFCIYSSDAYTNTEQMWVCENGETKIAESR